MKQAYNKPPEKYFLIILLILPILINSCCINEGKKTAAEEEECKLSLCDCRCHPADEDPDRGRLCGINCLNIYGVSGCEHREGRCVEKYLTLEDSRKTAEDFIKNTPTYRFDGFNLKYVKHEVLRCPYCWAYLYEYKSKHPGYGDRSNQTLEEAETIHKIKIVVEKGTVTYAVLDEVWDELKQEHIKNREEECKSDTDCEQENSRCADGVDPYHVCREGRCVNLTYIADPCLMEHVCPKGRWHHVSGNICIRYTRCSETGCDDNSPNTLDECVGVGTRSEACRYTVIEDKKTTCKTDEDCVPEQCCHPTSCVGRDYAPDCSNIACTMVCSGPIDCGAGRCACIEGRCTVISTSNLHK